MKQMRKITFAAAALVVALGGGFVATNYASANSDVLEGLSIANGMSIRMNDPEGLRFSASINMTKAEMEAAGILEVGSVLMPANKVEGALEYNETNGSATALLIPTAKYYEETADVSSWFSALVNTGETGEFPVEFYNTPIAARAYAKYSDTEYKYSENTVTRSIGYVAAINYLRNVEDEFGVIAKIASATEKEIAVDANLFVGDESTQATINVGGQALEAYEDVTVAWSVVGDAVSVDQTGKVTPVKAGSATLQAVVSVEGGNSVTLTKEVSVEVATTEVSETYFAMKQTNDAGEIVTNNYTYELTDANVESVSFVNGEALDASEYVVDGNTLTVYATAFEEVAGMEATLKVETASENVEIAFGRVATFAITKASDMNPGDASVVPAWQVANGMPANWSDPRSTAHRFAGYTVVANDIDFGGENIKFKVACANAWGGSHYGFAGVFDGMGHTLKNFMVVGTNVSLFGRIDFGAAIVDTNFINFRTGGTASFGLFDAACFASLLENLTIDGTCDSTANGGSLLGNLQYVAGAGGVTMKNCTITARVGNATETSNAVMGSGSSFLSVQNSKIYTQYKVPATFTTAGGTVEKLAAGEYYAMKVNGEAAHTLVANDYVQAVAGTSLTSVTLYKNAGAIDLTASAELAGGNVVIPASAFASYTGRGAAIKVVTDEETKWFYQDIVTYAVTQASDLHWNNATGALSNMVAAGNLGNKTWAGYIVLGNNVDCSSLPWVNTGSFCGNAASGEFTGTFDGRGYTISNINVDYSNNAWRQFFGTLGATAVVKNVSFVNAKAGWTTSYSFFGLNSQGKIDNVLIDVTPHKDDVTVFGRFWDGKPTITNCTVVIRNNAEGTLTKAGVIWSGTPVSSSNIKIYTDLTVYTKVGDVLPLSDYQA